MQKWLVCLVAVGSFNAFSVENGAPPNEEIYKAVGRFHFKFEHPDDRPARYRAKEDEKDCTASALGKYCAITVAHCVYEEAKMDLQLVDKADKKVVIEVDSKHTERANAFVAPREMAKLDYGMVRLNAEAPVYLTLDMLHTEKLPNPKFEDKIATVVWDAGFNFIQKEDDQKILKSVADAKGPELYIVGTGFLGEEDKAKKLKADPVGRSAGTVAFVGDIGELRKDQPLNLYFSYPKTAKYQGADSGAPTFLIEENKVKLFGIHKAGRPDNLMVDLTVSQNLDWIKDTYKKLKCDQANF